MVDGKLTEMECEPRVVLASSSGELGATTDALLLQDGEGVFMTVSLTQGLDTEQETAVEISGEKRGSEIATTPPMEDGSDSESDRLLVQLEQSRQEFTDLQATVEADRQRLESHLEEKEAEIAKLTDQVNELKRKARETWKTNCEALVLYDEECTAVSSL